MYSLRVQDKFVKARVKWFFLRNRDVQWTRRRLGLLLAFVLISGAFLGNAVENWATSGDTSLYRYAVVREAEASAPYEGATSATNGEIPSANTAIGYSEEGEQSHDPCTLRDVTCDGEDIEGVIMQLFPEDPKTALAIAKAESGLRANARNINRNGSTDTGIFQVNSVWGYSEEVLLDPIENVKIARKIYEKSGFWSWSAYNNKSYLKFL